MKLSKKGLDLLKQLEGFRSKPYLCSAGLPTIGYGSTRYTNGVRVSLRDPEISEAKAVEMLIFDVTAFENDVYYNQFYQSDCLNKRIREV